MKISTLLLAILVIFSSCKEEEPIDLCSNGFLDAGEEKPDCGGNCAPCEPVFVSSVHFKLNGQTMGVSSASLNYDGSDWALILHNDSLDLQVNLGTDGSIGNFTINQAGTTCSYNGIDYPLITNATSAVSQNDLEFNVMSGFFQLDYYRAGFSDTIKITNGQFDEFVY